MEDKQYVKLLNRFHIERKVTIKQQAQIEELVRGLRYAFMYMPVEEQRQHIADLVTKVERGEAPNG